MTMKQARAMRDGILKGDSAMAQAWKELLGGSAGGSASAATTGSSLPASTGERGEKTIARFKAAEEGW